MVCHAHHLATNSQGQSHNLAKNLLFHNRVMLHIKLKGMKRTTTHKQIFYTPLVLLICAYIQEISIIRTLSVRIPTVLSAKSDSKVMFCLQSYQGLIIDRSLAY